MLSNLLCIVALLAPLICWGDVLAGRVVGVADGDTVTVLVNGHDQVRVRLSGIDAPEKKQPYGMRAKQKLSDLIYDRTVTVQWDKKDRYGRTVGMILVNGQDAGLEVLRAGLAWHYKKYQSEQAPEDREQYSAAEVAARGARSGLWSEANPLPPWEWRRRGKRAVN